MKEAINLLHYVVEAIAIVGIASITVAYLVTGYYDTPIILGAFTTITAIASAETYRKYKETKS